MKKYISAFVLCFFVWVLLAGFSPPELLLGAAVSLVLAFLLAKILNLGFSWRTPVGLVLFLVLYIPVFIYELVKANIDVLYRVLNPKLPINPGFVKVRTEVPGKIGKLILANSITLTPGTISVDADEESIYVHWINVQGSGPGEFSDKVAGRFERILRRVFK